MQGTSNPFPSFLLPVTSHDTWPPCIKKCHIVFTCSQGTCPTITSSFLNAYSVFVVVVKGLRKYHTALSQTRSPNRLVDMMPTNNALETVRTFNLARHLHATRLVRRCGRLHPHNYENAYKRILPYKRIKPYHREL